MIHKCGGNGGNEATTMDVTIKIYMIERCFITVAALNGQTQHGIRN